MWAPFTGYFESTGAGSESWPVEEGSSAGVSVVVGEVEAGGSLSSERAAGDAEVSVCSRLITLDE